MATCSMTVAAVLSLCVAVMGQSSIDQCNRIECPSFTVLSSGANYELRRYDASKWAQTSYTSRPGFLNMFSNWRAQSDAFRRLFNYIQGTNSAGTKMDMTAPVIMKVVPNADGSMTRTMSFMVPAQHRASTPTPTDASVSLMDMPQTDVYVRTYGGFSRDSMEASKVNQLKDSLTGAGISAFQNSYYYYAGYDSPMTLFNRRNEIWVPKA